MMNRVLIFALALVASLLAVNPASAANPSLRICTANIQHTPDMPDWKVRQDAAEVRAHCDVVLWQEIRERADHRALKARGWRSTAYRTGGVPVSWRTSRVAVRGNSRLLRVSRPTPPCASRPSYNPSRYITMVPLRARATGKNFTAVSLHFPQRRTRCHQSTTTKRWSEAFANTKRSLPREALVVGGDWNRREGEIRDMTNQHWVTPAPRSLDHIFVARTGWRTVSKFRRNLWSDHHMLGARMRL